MADYLGDTKEAEEYREIFQKGYQWTRDNLFNGSYFMQKLDLTDKGILEHFGCEDVYWNEEAGEIKYQIGEGSILDQLLGQWHCVINGLGDVLDRDQMDLALESMMRDHYKASMREFTNPWRIFALNDEAGCTICDYPEGARKPRIPIPYCEETMHGFEYAFAGLLFAAGRIEDGLKVVKAVRDKYDGRKRNPWNEIECGSNYARAMASYALVPIYSGFSFDMSVGRIGFAPVKGEGKFLWSVAESWGTVAIGAGKCTLKIFGKPLHLRAFSLPGKEPVRIEIDGKPAEFTRSEDGVSFADASIRKKFTLVYTG